MELNQERIESAIVEEVAGRLVDEDHISQIVKNGVNARLDKIFRETADARIREAIESAIKNGFDRSYTRVSSFGEPVGATTTIRAELDKLVGDYWNTKVDKQGKPCSGYGADRTRAEWLMMQLVAADFHGEMKQHVVNLGGALKDKLRAQLHETVNGLLSEVFRVRSVDDVQKQRGGTSLNYPEQKL